MTMSDRGGKEIPARENRMVFACQASGADLALQLRVPFEVGFLRCGLMASAPDGPGDDEGRFNATLDQTPGNTTDFLE